MLITTKTTASEAGHTGSGIGFTRGQALTAALLFAVSLLNYIDRQVLSVLVPVMKDQIGLTTAQYAWAVNSFLLAYGFMYTGSGVVLDRLGSRIGLALFVACWSLASGLHACLTGFAGLVLLRFLLGLTEPGGWTGAIKTISERFGPLQRGLAAGIFASGACVATLIAPPLVVFLSLHYGWRMAFLIPSLAGLAWLPLWLIVTRQPPQDADNRARRGGLSLKEGWALLRDRRVLGYALARFFGDSTGYFLMFWIPEYLSTVKGFSFVMIGTLAWIPFLFNDVGPLTGGYASSRLIQRGFHPLLARKTIMTIAPFFVAVGALSVSATQTWTVLASLSVAAFGVGLWVGNLHALPADAFDPRNVATVYGLAGSAGAVGGIVFNTLVGHWSASSNYTAVFAMLILLQPLGVSGLWLFLRDPLHKGASETG